MFYYHLAPLDSLETRQYINHRLEKAGNKIDLLFPEEAMEEIYRYSNGIPRLINLACHNSLITGLVQGTKCITREMVRLSMEDLMHNTNKFQREEIAEKLMPTM